MFKPWKLKRTAQCKACPWRTSTNPLTDIPGYDREQHVALARTIAAPLATDADALVAELQAQLRGEAPQHVFTCHETEAAHCIGWLAHQLGPGNNLLARLQLMSCTNGHRLRTFGPQHVDLSATLPPPERGSIAG